MDLFTLPEPWHSVMSEYYNGVLLTFCYHTTYRDTLEQHYLEGHHLYLTAMKPMLIGANKQRNFKC